MTNDLSTLSGALLEMKDQLIYELGQKGVTATYSSTTGLLGLVGKIADIQTGGGGTTINTDILLTSNVTSTETTATLTALLTASVTGTVAMDGVVSGATITIKDGSNNTIGTMTTDSTGTGTLTVTLSDTTTYTAYFSGTTDLQSSTSNNVTVTKVSYVIPSPYVAVEYLQSDGSQYINTGYTLQATDIVDVTVSMQGSGSYNGVFGARKSSSSNNCYALFGRFGSQNKFCYARTGNEAQGNTITTNTIYNVVTNGASCIVSQEGNVVQTITNSGTLNDCVNPCGLFVLNTSGSNGVFSKDTYGYMKIYSFKIMDNQGVYKRYMKPCRNGTTGYMYDFITEQAKADYGTFKYGSDI